MVKAENFQIDRAVYCHKLFIKEQNIMFINIFQIYQEIEPPLEVSMINNESLYILFYY